MKLDEALKAYFALCASRLQAHLEAHPELRVSPNPALVYRELVAKLEETREFTAAACAFEGMLSEPLKKGTFKSSEGPPFGRFLVAFLANAGAYDRIISGIGVDGAEMTSRITTELSCDDNKIVIVAFLENFACDVPSVDCVSYRIRHLTDQEITAFFVDHDELRRQTLPGKTIGLLREEYFAVVEEEASPLQGPLHLGVLGLHDFLISPFRSIALGLNLFKTSPLPVVIRKSYARNMSPFHDRADKPPQQGDDLYPSSWSNEPDPPRMRAYELTSDDVEPLVTFLGRFDTVFVKVQFQMPRYFHRAIHHFLLACKWERTDLEMRQLLYVMCLEAMYSGLDEEEVRPQNKKGNRVGTTMALSTGCAMFVSSDYEAACRLGTWLHETAYAQRSSFAHGASFEGEGYLDNVGDEPWRDEVVQLCHDLGVNPREIWEEVDYAFAVLHNIARRSIMLFMCACCAVAESVHGKDLLGQIEAVEREGQAAKRWTKEARERQEALRATYEKLHEDAKRELLQRLFDAFGARTSPVTLRVPYSSLFDLAS